MASVIAFPAPITRLSQTVFERTELLTILNLYGRMVAAGLWRDYAIAMATDHAVFSAFRRASERPEAEVWKRPALRTRQGTYALVGEGGMVLKRGAELRSVLAPLERRLVKVASS
jgi:hypothetical protein